jgi:hypothetical protein
MGKRNFIAVSKKKNRPGLAMAGAGWAPRQLTGRGKKIRTGFSQKMPPIGKKIT